MDVTTQKRTEKWLPLASTIARLAMFGVTAVAIYEIAQKFNENMSHAASNNVKTEIKAKINHSSAKAATYYP